MRAVSVRSIVTAGLARVRAFRDRFRVWEVRYRWWTWKARVLETVRSWARAAAWTGLVVVIPPLGVFILMAETGLWVYPGVPRRLYGLAEYGLAQAWFCGRGQFYRLACLAYRRGMFDYQAFVEKAGDRAPRGPRTAAASGPLAGGPGSLVRRPEFGRRPAGDRKPETAGR